MTRTVLTLAFLLSLVGCGRPDRIAQEHTASGATMLRATPESVAGGSDHYNVWPTGDPAADVSNIQWAVDHARAGGVVSLKASNKLTGVPMPFEFGADGSVDVRTSVSIEGQVDDDGVLLTTIHGGYRPITCDDASVSLTIATLRFDGARRTAIHVRRSSSVKIIGNVIAGLLPTKEIGYPFPVAYHAAAGIEMGSLACQSPDPANANICLDRPVPLGTVEVSNNSIDLGIYGPDGHLLDPTVVYPNATAAGMPLEDTSFSGIDLIACEATATVSGNTIRNTTRRGIHALDTFGSQLIVGNTIETAPFSSAAPGTASPRGYGKRNFGIFPYNGHRMPEGAVHGATHTVVRNTVVLASDVAVDGPHGVGVIAGNGVADAELSENAVIYRAGARNGISVIGNLSLVSPARPRRTTIRDNTIDATSYVPQPAAPYFGTPTHIFASSADSTTIDTNEYVGGLPAFVILGTGTGVVDPSHPNTIVDANCGPASAPQDHPKISFANLASCTQP